MSERFGLTAALVAVVVLVGTIAGGLVATAIRDRGDGRGGVVTTATTTPTTATTPFEPGPLPACTGPAGTDPAAVEVCAVEALVGLLRQGSDLDAPTASCAAEAVVDELGVDAVIAALETGVAPPDLRARLQAAFAACGASG